MRQLVTSHLQPESREQNGGTQLTSLRSSRTPACGIVHAHSDGVREPPHKHAKTFVSEVLSSRPLVLTITVGFIHTKTALQKATLRNGNPSHDLGENIRQVPSDKGLVSKIDKEPSQLDSTKK